MARKAVVRYGQGDSPQAFISDDELVIEQTGNLILFYREDTLVLAVPVHFFISLEVTGD